MTDPTHWFNLAAAAFISSGVGGVIGGLVAWGGIRIRLDHLEKKVACLSASVVFKDVCQQCRDNASERESRVEQDIKDIKNDIKTLLSRSFKTRETD